MLWLLNYLLLYETVAHSEEQNPKWYDTSKSSKYSTKIIGKNIPQILIIRTSQKKY